MNQCLERGPVLHPVVPDDSRLRDRVKVVSQFGDPSDAGPELHASSAREFESTADWPEHRRTVIHTDVQSWRSSLPACADWIRSLSH